MRAPLARLLIIALAPIVCFGIELGAARASDALRHGQDAEPVFLPLLGNYRASQPLAAGVRHTCAILDDGQVQCWGDNEFGQLGDGSHAASPLPVTVQGLSGALALASGGYDTCAVSTDGRVSCWGMDYGALPVSVAGVSGATAISAGTEFGCAIVAGGRVQCWGHNADFEWEDPGVTGAVAIASGFRESCALLGDGSLRCWPFGDEGVIHFPGVEDARAVAVGGWYRYKSGRFQVCVIGESGQVRCWYGDRGGMFVDPEEPAPPVAVPGAEGALALAAGRAGAGHLCTIFEGGYVGCWYDNSSGQFGIGERTDYPGLFRVDGVADARAIAAGAEHACALLKDNRVLCWGDNRWGQLGTQAIDVALTPVAVQSVAPEGPLAAGHAHTCARMPNGETHCWGSDWEHALGDGVNRGYAGARYRSAPVRNMDGVTGLVAGRQAACAIRPSYGASCWGSSLINGGDDSTLQPRPVAGMATATQLAVGGYHACALTSAGEPWCWGAGYVGQLGTGLRNDAVDPVRVVGLVTVRAIAAGSFHSCALQRNGRVACWGDNGYGQVGDGTYETRLAPVQVAGAERIRALALGGGGYEGGHSCALTEDGEILCWGANSTGQLGDGSTDNQRSPVVVHGINDATAIAAGARHTCALVSGGRIACWGSNERGQLGDGAGGRAGAFSATPVAVATIAGASALVAGGDHTCAVVEGTLYCWGNNHDGELGLNPGWAPVYVTGLGG